MCACVCVSVCVCVCECVHMCVCVCVCVLVWVCAFFECVLCLLVFTSVGGCVFVGFLRVCVGVCLRDNSFTVVV